MREFFNGRERAQPSAITPIAGAPATGPCQLQKCGLAERKIPHLLSPFAPGDNRARLGVLGIQHSEILLN